MVLDISLLNTQHYKVRIKGKFELSRERCRTLPYTLVLQLLKREPSGYPRLRSPTLLTFYLKCSNQMVFSKWMPDCKMLEFAYCILICELLNIKAFVCVNERTGYASYKRRGRTSVYLASFKNDFFCQNHSLWNCFAKICFEIMTREFLSLVLQLELQ